MTFYKRIKVKKIFMINKLGLILLGVFLFSFSKAQKISKREQALFLSYKIYYVNSADNMDSRHVLFNIGDTSLVNINSWIGIINSKDFPSELKILDKTSRIYFSTQTAYNYSYTMKKDSVKLDFKFKDRRTISEYIETNSEYSKQFEIENKYNNYDGKIPDIFLKKNICCFRFEINIIKGELESVEFIPKDNNIGFNDIYWDELIGAFLYKDSNASYPIEVLVSFTSND